MKHTGQADLIVLGTRGRTKLEYVLLGSTAEGLLRELDCSVLSIRARDAIAPLNLTRTTTRMAL